MPEAQHPLENNGTPRWVKVSAIVALVVVALVIVLVLTGGGGNHGPGRHMGGLSAVDVARSR